jgi:hypothetical protein
MSDLAIIAQRRRWRISLTLDKRDAGRSTLDTLDVWDGKPETHGARLVAREPCMNRPLEVVAQAVLKQIVLEGE